MTVILRMAVMLRIHLSSGTAVEDHVVADTL
jgi:hypothetical protein